MQLLLAKKPLTIFSSWSFGVRRFGKANVGYCNGGLKGGGKGMGIKGNVDDVGKFVPNLLNVKFGSKKLRKPWTRILDKSWYAV